MRSIKTLFCLIVLPFCLIHPAFAQQQTPQQISLEGMKRACNAVADELLTAREYISKLEAEGKSHAEAVAIERERAKAALAALELSKQETAAQVGLNKVQAEQITAQAKQNDELSDQLTTTKAKLATMRKVAVGAVVLFVLAVAAASR